MANKKTKGFIFISNVTKALEHEWFADFVDQKQFDLQFVLFNSRESELLKYLKSRGFTVVNYQLNSNIQLPLFVCYFWIKLLFLRPHFVHAHLFQAGLIGITAAWLAAINKRIYTRHHSDFHHTFHPHAIKYDLWINRLSTHIIAVSQNVKTILLEKESVPESKLTVVPHGIPLVQLEKEVPIANILRLSEKHNPKKRSPVIGVVSRMVEWKGIKYTIAAYKDFLAQEPNALLILANASGPLEQEIDQQLSELPTGSYLKIAFENEMSALWKCFDVFVHVPIDSTCEAFGQVYIESMAAGVPMICTLSGIAPDLVIDEKNALVVPFMNAKAILEHLLKLTKDAETKKTIVSNARNDVKAFTFENKFEKIRQIYLS